MGVSSSATTVTNVLGATSGFALIGAFLSDSYITRSRTILLFGPLEFLGYGLLALQAYLHSVHQLAILKQKQVSAKKSMAGMPPCCMQPCISAHLVMVVCVLACHPSEQISLTMKIPLSHTSNPASLIGTPLGSPLEVL